VRLVHGTARPGAAIALACGALLGCHPVGRLVEPARAAPLPAAFRWDLPPGFPAPKVPADNPMTSAKVELGRQLFYDTRLSGTGTYACATCHRQELAFTDGLPRAVGATAEPHPRSAPSLANVAYNASLTWADPEVTTLEEQAHSPMLNEHPVELGLAGREQQVLSRLHDDPRYVEMFDAAFPGDTEAFTLDNVAKAIAAFERTLISGDSPYNRLVWGGEMDALSDSARRGMRLFFSDRLQCSECHAGFTLSGPAAFEGDRGVRPAFHNTGLYDVDGLGSYPDDNRGLVDHSGLPEDMGKFRAPTLYNVAVTAPYMHDGSVATLAEVLDIYAAGGRRVTSGPHAGDGRTNRNKSFRVTGFGLTGEEKGDLLAFLESLTDERFLTDPRLGNPFDDSVVEAPTSAPDTGAPTTRAGLSASGRTTP